MKTNSLVWLGLLLFAAAAIVALAWYAFSTDGAAPLALVGAAPLVVLCRIAVRRLRPGRQQ